MESFTFPDKIKMDIFKPFFGANLLPYAFFVKWSFKPLFELC